MKMILFILAVLLLLLQYPLWFGKHSYYEVWQLSQTRSDQQQENQNLRQRNKQLSAEVDDLKSGHAAIEEIARSEMGMVDKDETFYLIVEE